MAANNRRDVQLVIRARDDASKAVEAINAILEKLAKAQRDIQASGGSAADGLKAQAEAVKAAEAAYAKITATLTAAEAAFERQKTGIAATGNDIGGMKAQAEAARTAIVSLALAARESNDPAAQARLNAARDAYRTLTAQIERAEASLAGQQRGAETASAALERARAAAAAAALALGSLGDPAARAGIDAAAKAAAAAATEQARLASEAAKLRAELDPLAAAQARLNAELAKVRELAAAGAISTDELAKAEARLEADARRAMAAIEAQSAAGRARAAADKRTLQENNRQRDELRARINAIHDAETREIEDAKKLRAELDPLGAALGRIAVRLEQVRDLYNKGRISAQEFAAAQAKLARDAKQAEADNANSRNGRGGLFGLKPYEMQNLGYQVNDVITQISSGTSITQTFAQQGGQILQLIPGLGAALLALLPTLAAAAAVIVPFALGIKTLIEERTRIREFTGELLASADGARYQAEALTESARALDKLGVSAEQSKATLQQFIKDGIAPERMNEFARAARNLADVVGGEVPEAASKIGPAFTKGFEAIKQLDDQFNFLTATEREYIRTLFDSGKAAEARDEAFRIFYDRQAQAAQLTKGPWAQAVRDFTGAWKGLLDELADSAIIQSTVNGLGNIAAAVNAVFGRDKGGPIVRTLQDINAEIANLEGLLARAGSGQAFVAPEALAGMRAQLAALRTERDNFVAPATDTRLAETEAIKKARDEALLSFARQKSGLGDLTDAQRIRREGEIAYQDSIRTTGDVATAEAARQIAALKEIDRQRKALNFGTLANKIIGVESGGNPNAKNPDSSALGLGQFIESTFLTMFRRYFPAEAEGKTRQQILDLRRDSDISRRLVELYARENADILKKAGLATTEASLYLAHFLGPNGAMKVLRAAPNAPIAPLVGREAVAKNPTILGGGATAGSVINFAERKVGTSDMTRQTVNVQAEVTNKLAAAERAYNKGIEDRIQALRNETAAKAVLNGIEKLGTAERFAAERASTVALAVSKEEATAVEANTTLTAARRSAIEQLVGALYDLENAERQAKEVAAEKRGIVNDLIGLDQQRTVAVRALNAALRSGDAGAADDARRSVGRLGTEIRRALPGARALAAELGDEKMVANLDGVELRLETLRTEIVTTADVNQAFTNSFSQGFNTFTQAIANGENFFSSLGAGFAAFAASFLQQIAQMIIQALALKFIMSALGLGASSSIAGAVNTLISHEGGVVGGGGARRDVSPMLFAAATRYHMGGLAGLRPNEVPAILERNEEVLTAKDPRHRFNGGLGGGMGGKPGPMPSIKVVNTIDSGDFVSKGLNTKAGERTMMNFIRTRRGEIKEVLK